MISENQLYKMHYTSIKPLNLQGIIAEEIFFFFPFGYCIKVLYGHREDAAESRTYRTVGIYMQLFPTCKLVIACLFCCKNYGLEVSLEHCS